MAVSIHQEERLQQSHYDRIASTYEAHYDDRCSQRYRQRFIFQPMFAGIELNGKDVLDAMCGSGSTTHYLLARGARVTGLDISEQSVRSYGQRWPGNRAIHASILRSGIPDATYDCVAIVGGLHHLHPDVGRAIDEIHRILKPGGYLCFVEPHQGSLLDRIRAWWYRRDPLFASNERAIDLPAVKASSTPRFHYLPERYGGGIAYLLVLNSLIFRIPLGLKPWYTPVLLVVESLLSFMHGKRFSCFVICRWRKR